MFVRLGPALRYFGIQIPFCLLQYQGIFFAVCDGSAACCVPAAAGELIEPGHDGGAAPPAAVRWAASQPGRRFEAGPARHVSPKIDFAPFRVPPASLEAVDLVEELCHEMLHFPILRGIFRPGVSDEQRAVDDGLHRRPFPYQVRINIVGQFTGQIFGEDRREAVPGILASSSDRKCTPSSRFSFAVVECGAPDSIIAASISPFSNLPMAVSTS